MSFEKFKPFPKLVDRESFESMDEGLKSFYIMDGKGMVYIE